MAEATGATMAVAPSKGKWSSNADRGRDLHPTSAAGVRGALAAREEARMPGSACATSDRARCGPATTCASRALARRDTKASFL